ELLQQFLSTPATYLGLLALVCLYRDRSSTEHSPASPAHGRAQPTSADWVLVVGLAGLPVVGWLLANLVTGFVLFRSAIAPVIGFSLVVAMLCQTAAARRPALPLFLAAWVAVTGAASTMDFRTTTRTTMFTRNHIAIGSGCFRLLTLAEKLPQEGLPIVVSD